MEEGYLEKREEEDRTHGSWSGNGESRLKILDFPRRQPSNEIKYSNPYSKSYCFAESVAFIRTKSTSSPKLSEIENF